MSEAYLRSQEALAGARSEADFARQFAVIARNFVIDELRRRGSLKRGGVRPAVELKPDVVGRLGIDWTRLELWELLDRCERVEPVYFRLLVGYYLGGLSSQELAAQEEISLAAAKRGLVNARAFLLTLARDEADD